MFRVIAWTAVVSSACTTALFVPIDPTVLQVLGLSSSTTSVARNVNSLDLAQIAPTSTASTDIRDKAAPASKMDVRVVTAETASPYSARNAVNTNTAAAPLSAEKPNWAASWSGIWSAGRPVPATAQAHAATEVPKPIEVTRLAIAAAPRVQPISALPDNRAPTSFELVNQLQSELQRVGCYAGRIDGDWGPASRFAMAEFTKSVNAVLPTDRPDEILLSLVRRHAGPACGNNPTDTIVAGTGRSQLAAAGAASSSWTVRVTSVAPSAAASASAAPIPAGHGAAQNSPVKAAAPQLLAAPRILSRNTVQLSASGLAEVAPSSGRQPQDTVIASRFNTQFADRRMLLGAAASDERGAPTPVTVAPEPQPAYQRQRANRDYAPNRARPPRAESRQRRYGSERRARSKRWLRQVLQPVNLGGS